MDIQSILDETLSRIAGASYVSCIGTDGIALAQSLKEPNFDPAVADAEFANVLGHTQKSANSIEAGDFQEIFFVTTNLTVLMRRINPDAFLSIVLAGGVQNLGLARIEAKKAVQKLQETLR